MKNTEKLEYSLSYKYKNYKILFKKLNNYIYDNSGEELLFISPELKKHYKDLLDIKKNILLGNKPIVLNKVKQDLYLILLDLKNISEKYHNSKYIINDGEQTLTKGIDSLINSTATEIHKGKLNIDLFLGVFKLVNLIKELKKFPKNIYKLSIYQSSNIQNNIQVVLYGQGFEALNSLLLSQSLGLKFKEIPSLEHWDYVNSKRQFELWSKKEGNNFKWDQWYFNKDISNKDKFNIPSMDLEAKNGERTIYVENKNFTVARSGTFNLNLRYAPELLLKHMTKMETLRKFKCDLYYNINTYNSIKMTSNHYYIPMEVLKKFYQKINKQVTIGIKKSIRDGVKSKSIDLDLTISDEPIQIKLNYNLKGKEFFIQKKAFDVSIKSTSFENLFEKYKIYPRKDKDIKLELER